jgi:hypothetical protein
LKLDLLDRATGSDLDRYRSEIIQQLKQNQEFFFRCLLESQKEQGRQKRIVYVSITVVEGSAARELQEGVNVSQVVLKPFYDDMEEIKELIGFMTKVKPGNAAIGFAFEFKMYCWRTMVSFMVLMWFELEEKELESQLRNSGRMGDLTWNQKIINGLSDPLSWRPVKRRNFTSASTGYHHSQETPRQPTRGRRSKSRR